MKNSLLLAFLMLPLSLYAEQRAITSTGDEVLLHDNGTWIYVKDTKAIAAPRKNPTPFTKPVDASFEVKSKINKAGIWINPTLWKFKKSTNNEAAEYEFQLDGADVYGLMINESIEVPTASLMNIALDNARKVAVDAQVTEQEYRTVNGNELIFARIDGTMQGIKLSYLSYYFANASGSTQLVIYTGRNLVDTYRDAIESFLNGLVIE